MGKENHNVLLAWEWLGNVCCNLSNVQKMDEGLWKNFNSPYTSDTVGAIGRPSPGLQGWHELRLDL